MFSTHFISATKECSTLETFIPAPYLRRSFSIKASVKKASITICGLGFYELFINGKRITKGLLAPYVSNPDDILYYDSYEIGALLNEGKNALGIMLGNGMLNCPGGQVWDFENVRYRSAPKVALAVEIEMENGEIWQFEADENFRCAPSPIYYDDLRAGEFYDARNEIPGWNLPGFDDSAWSPALIAETPRGECRLCQAESILPRQEIAPYQIRPARIGLHPDEIHNKLPQILPQGDEAREDGYLYDFGVNAAGVCRLKIKGKRGQKIILQFAEELDENGNLDLRGMHFMPKALNHRDIYICKGEEEEIYQPSFTFHGFRYCLVIGIEECQAKEDLLTFVVMNSALPERGDFSCSDPTLNALQKATQVSDLANFYYFPLDCPHREKNGWTADAALSCEQMLLNFGPENSYREWLHNIRKAQREDGALPGIIPTGGWGFEWGNGPAWDCVLIYLPYFVWRYRGDTKIIQENAGAIMRYLHYITTKRDEKGLIHIGLGDWCHCARKGAPKAPLEVTDTLMCMDIAQKSALLFDAIGMDMQKDFSMAIYHSFRASARKHLIDLGSMSVQGNCQSCQAMGIFYNLFEEAEKPAAFSRLLELIEEQDRLMDVGVLGGRVLFRVLSQFDRSDLAYEMITTPRFPSYGNWIQRGATSLWESFHSPDQPPNSHNHHFWGDISGWMFENIAGLQINPHHAGPNHVIIHPHFVSALSHACAHHDLPGGRIRVSWKRKGENIFLSVQAPNGCSGQIVLDAPWQFENGCTAWPLASNDYLILKKDFPDS